MKKLITILIIAFCISSCQVDDTPSIDNTFTYELYSEDNILPFNILFLDDKGQFVSFDISLNDSLWETVFEIGSNDTIPRIWLPKINSFIIHVDICLKGSCKSFQHTGDTASYSW